MSLKYEPASEPLHIDTRYMIRTPHPENRNTLIHPLVESTSNTHPTFHLRILVYLAIYDYGQVSLEHLLLSRQPSQPSDIHATGRLRGGNVCGA